MRLRLFLLVLFAFVYMSLRAQQTTTSTTPTQSASDPAAVAVVQAAVTAIGGATAVAALQSWTFRAQATGRIANGPITEFLTSSVPQNSNQPAGTTVKAPPPWARPRSLFVPGLIGAILQKQSQDINFSVKQGAVSPSLPNSSVVLFSVKTRTGASFPAQRWYFDMTSGLPSRIDFLLPALLGRVEGFPGTVLLSDYRAVGGVLYPFKIVTLIQHQYASETITLQSVTPTATTPTGNATSGGVQ